MNKWEPIGPLMFVLMLVFGSLTVDISQAEDALIGLPALQTPHETPRRDHLVSLGKTLFFDPRLSADRTISCSSCHSPALDFADGKEKSTGVGSRIGTRNAPSLLNVAHLDSLFWDGRVGTLEEQAELPFLTDVEHDLANNQELLSIVRGDRAYIEKFNAAFDVAPGAISVTHVTKAIAAFEATLLAGNSPFDRYLYGNEPHAMTEEATRGFNLFRGRAGCSSCHLIGKQSSLLTNQKFEVSAVALPPEVTVDLASLAQRIADIKQRHDINELNRLISTDPKVAALGRYVVTLDPRDIGRFKTPSLRNVARTAPYMHDGSIATLEQVVDLELYRRGTPVEYPIILTSKEKSDLVEFLKALTSPPFKL